MRRTKKSGKKISKSPDWHSACQSHSASAMAQVKECRMYENKFPEVDECVMVQVRSIAEM